jgi:hypothetical protein
MKTYIDRKKIGARAELSNLASIGGLLLLLASVLLPLFLPKAANFSFWLMVAGLGTAMLGIYFANRWVRKPRPEDGLDKALKGLADNYHLYHYPSLPCDHLLLSPNGVVILETVSLPGLFSYKDGHWREAMTIGRALRYIVEEHVGDPIKSAARTGRYLQERIRKIVAGETEVPVKPLVVFVHPGAFLEVENASVPVLRAEKLKKQVTIDAPRLDAEVYEALDSFFQDLTLKK